MTNAPKNPHTALIEELVGYIRALIEDFPLGQEVPQSGSFKRLEASLKKLQESPPLVTDYLLLVFNAVTIQWAAHETGRDVEEILEELARGFNAVPTD